MDEQLSPIPSFEGLVNSPQELTISAFRNLKLYSADIVLKDLQVVNEDRSKDRCEFSIISSDNTTTTYFALGQDAREMDMTIRRILLVQKSRTNNRATIGRY